jgi:hypothetical protein
VRDDMKNQQLLFFFGSSIYELCICEVYSYVLMFYVHVLLNSDYAL